MPRRKKTVEDKPIDNRRAKKTGRRVDLSVRVAKPAPTTIEDLEQDYEEVIETSDGLTQKAISETAVSPETVREIARKIADLKIERDKKLLMWVGVTLFMAVILAVWVYNLKYLFKSDRQPGQNERQLNIDEISANFNKTMAEVSGQLNKLNDLASTTPSAPSATGTAQKIIASSSVNFEETEEIKRLRLRLEELEQRLGVPATSTKK